MTRRLRCAARLERWESRAPLSRRGWKARALLPSLSREVASRELLCEPSRHARDPIAAEAREWRWSTDLIKARERRVAVKGWERTKKLRRGVVRGAPSTGWR